MPTKQEHTQRFTIIWPKETLAIVIKLAREEGRSISNMVKFAVQEYIRRKDAAQQ